MWSKHALLLSCRSRRDHIAKWLFFRRPSESAGFPSPQIILNTAFNWFAEDQPRLPHRRRDAPHSASPFPKFVLLEFAIFHKTIRWIRHDGFDTVRLCSREPLKAITVNERRITESESSTRRGNQWRAATVLLLN